MATYLELSNIQSETGWADFSEKVKTACIIKATAVIDSATPSVEALAWANSALNNPARASGGIIWYVIGSNDNLAIATILAASDSAIQTNVNTAVDALYP